jgi:hypothetical protein
MFFSILRLALSSIYSTLHSKPTLVRATNPNHFVLSIYLFIILFIQSFIYLLSHLFITYL